MPWSFWTNYVLALATVAVVLAGLFVLTRRLARARVLASTERRLVTVLESTMLAQHASVHVVRVGGRYLFVGVGNAALSTLLELSRDEIEPVLRRRSQPKST
jgi:flagellar biogenesis protein FliO